MSGAALTGERVCGTVVSFDTAAGLGIVAGAGGGKWWFHCTQIADGTREIDAKTEVTFVVAPARMGGWQAVEVTPL